MEVVTKSLMTVCKMAGSSLLMNVPEPTMEQIPSPDIPRLSGHELFDLFTANIIRSEVIFYR